MSSPKAAPRAAAPKALSLAAMLSPARAEASRKNGAKSKGPKTSEGKARASRNALKHGLRAQKYVVLGDEDEDAFEALEAALMAELAPEGALQAVLARRIVAATWRLERAERMEAELFAQNIWGTTSFGLAMIRDSNGPRAFETLLRYRGTTLAELWRSLRTLKALQAEAAQIGDAASAPVRRATVAPAPAAAVRAPAPALMARPDEPERRKNPGDAGRAGNPAERNTEPGAGLARLPLPLLAPGETASCVRPIEPESRKNPGEPAARPAEIARNASTSLLAGTALVPARPWRA